MHVYGDQRTITGRWFSPSSRLRPGDQIQSSGLVASAEPPVRGRVLSVKSPGFSWWWIFFNQSVRVRCSGSSTDHTQLLRPNDRRSNKTGTRNYRCRNLNSGATIAIPHSQHPVARPARISSGPAPWGPAPRATEYLCSQLPRRSTHREILAAQQWQDHAATLLRRRLLHTGYARDSQPRHLLPQVSARA